MSGSEPSGSAASEPGPSDAPGTSRALARPSRVSVASAVAAAVVAGAFAALATLGTTRADAVDDDLLAYRLYEEGRTAEAAELFTDPAWKGVALYRSGQWWRAADAFVRADDPLSAYNLGNCYVRLGYHALALEAYRRALAGDPTLEDARFNAELMVRLLEREEDEGQASGQAPAEEEIERIEGASDEEEGAGAGEAGDEDSETGVERAPGEAAEGSESGAPSGEEAEPGEGGESRDEESVARGGEGGGSIDGERGDEPAASRASGVAESGVATEASEAAGLRSTLERDQATEQWLNRIAHDPQRYLERRIALELRRRRAAGQSAPAGGSDW